MSADLALCLDPNAFPYWWSLGVVIKSRIKRLIESTRKGH